MLILIVILTWNSNSFAGDITNDNESEWLLSKPSTCRFSGRFTQLKHITGLNTELYSQGVFFHDCNQGVIWKTYDPIVETLVIQNSGKSFLKKNEITEVLKSQQSKKINQIIIALISGDQTNLEKLFNVTQSELNKAVLEPKNRRLKKVIAKIVLSSSTNSTQTGDLAKLEMEMKEVNGQITLITSSITKNYLDSVISTQTICIETQRLEGADCELLTIP